MITGRQNWVHHFGGVLATVILWLVQFGLPHMSPNLEYPVNWWKSTKFEYWLGVTKHFHLRNPKWVQHLQILINKIEPVGGIWWYNGSYVGGWSPNFETAYAVMFGDTQLIDMWVPLYAQFSLWADLPIPHVLSLSLHCHFMCCFTV